MDGYELADYEHILPIEKLSHVLIDGDVSLYSLRFQRVSHKYCLLLERLSMLCVKISAMFPEIMDPHPGDSECRLPILMVNDLWYSRAYICIRMIMKAHMD